MKTFEVSMKQARKLIKLHEEMAGEKPRIPEALINGLLMPTGAKLYRSGGKKEKIRFFLSGYSADGRDVISLLEKIGD